jgi:hypothetical protein
MYKTTLASTQPNMCYIKQYILLLHLLTGVYFMQCVRTRIAASCFLCTYRFTNLCVQQRLSLTTVYTLCTQGILENRGSDWSDRLHP